MKIASKKERSPLAGALEKLLSNKEVMSSKSEWADFINVSEVAISNWLTDKNAPKPEHLNTILDYFGEDRYFPEGVEEDLKAFEDVAARPLEEVTPIADKFKGARTIADYMLKPKISAYFVELTILPAKVQEQLIYFNTQLCRSIYHFITFKKYSVDSIADKISRLNPELLLKDTFSLKNIVSGKKKKENLSKRVFAFLSVLEKNSQFSVKELACDSSHIKVRKGQLIFDPGLDITEKLQQNVQNYILELIEDPERNVSELKEIISPLSQGLTPKELLIIAAEDNWPDWAISCLPSVSIKLDKGKYLVWNKPLRCFKSKHYEVKNRYNGKIQEIKLTKRSEVREMCSNFFDFTNDQIPSIPDFVISNISKAFYSQVYIDWMELNRVKGHQYPIDALSEESISLAKSM